MSSSGSVPLTLSDVKIFMYKGKSQLHGTGAATVKILKCLSVHFAYWSVRAHVVRPFSQHHLRLRPPLHRLVVRHEMCRLLKLCITNQVEVVSVSRTHRVRRYHHHSQGADTTDFDLPTHIRMIVAIRLCHTPPSISLSISGKQRKRTLSSSFIIVILSS